MTAAWAFAIILLLLAIVFLAGEAHGRRRERIVRERMRRRVAENAYDELTIALAMADPADLAGNDRHSWGVRRRFEVVA